MIFETQETERQTLPFGKWVLDKKNALKKRNNEKEKKKEIIATQGYGPLTSHMRGK